MNKERDEWCEAITQCLKKLPETEPEPNDRILETAPVWIPDDFSDTCMIPGCSNKFTLTRRRHHCRYCGKLICSSCSKNQLPHFHSSNNEIVRIGPHCFDKYKHHFPLFINATTTTTKQRKRSSIIDLMQIKMANSSNKKRKSLSMKKRSNNALSPLPSIC